MQPMFHVYVPLSTTSTSRTETSKSELTSLVSISMWYHNSDKHNQHLHCVTAVCLRPRFPLLCFPSRLRMLFASFRVSSPPRLRPFLGRSRPSSWLFASLLFPRTQCSLDPKLGKGTFLFRLRKFGLFGLWPCTFVQY
jgi:hypothetical protein